MAVDGNRVETKVTVNCSHPHLNMAFSIHKKEVHRPLWHLDNMAYAVRELTISYYFKPLLK